MLPNVARYQLGHTPIVDPANILYIIADISPFVKRPNKKVPPAIRGSRAASPRDVRTVGSAQSQLLIGSTTDSP